MMVLADALEVQPVRYVRLPAVSYERLVEHAIRTAVTPVEQTTVATEAWRSEDARVSSRCLPPSSAEPVVRRSPVTQPGYRKGIRPANAGKRWPADPPNLQEIRAMLDACAGPGPTRVRLRALIVVWWRAGLRVQESLDLLPKDAFELANEGVPVHFIQRQLGHSSLATTDRYISHLAPAAVVKVMNARTWGLDNERSAA